MRFGIHYDEGGEERREKGKGGRRSGKENRAGE
jgi:hypothetical protein